MLNYSVAELRIIIDEKQEKRFNLLHKCCIKRTKCDDFVSTIAHFFDINQKRTKNRHILSKSVPENEQNILSLQRFKNHNRL